MPLRAPSRKRCRASCHRWGCPRWRASGFRVRRRWGQGISPGKTGACAGHHSRLASTGPAWIDASPTIPGHSSRSPEAPDAAGAHAGHVRVLVTSWTATVRAHAAAPWTSDVVRATGGSHIAITCAPTAARPAPSRVHHRRQSQRHRACTNGGKIGSVSRDRGPKGYGWWKYLGGPAGCVARECGDSGGDRRRPVRTLRWLSPETTRFQ
jgi:hypothetical protein